MDRKILDHLIAEGKERDAQRLRRLAMSHANVWTSARPSVQDGKDCVLTSCVSDVCEAPSRSTCYLCSCPLSFLHANHGYFGDHALYCKKSGDLITRHNRVRNLVFHFADVGLLSPELEKLGILGPTDRSKRRPPIA